ncbi:MAG TPA: hypothetical protein VKD70_07465 [Candidatus Acidoferrum sp.]|nr:hypothetical protein [Candidatus Acidoferrum sp.]
MFCPKCLQEIPASSTVCPFCAHSLAPGEILSERPGARGVPPPPPPPLVRQSFLSRFPDWLLAVLTIVGAILVLAIGFYHTKLAPHSSESEKGGYLFGALLVPTLIAWLIVWLATRKRNPPIPSNHKGVMGISIALFVSLLSLAGGLKPYRPRTESETKDRIARLAKEGTGQAPKSADEGKFDEIIRPFFADIKKFNDDYMAEVNALDKSAIAPLYGAKTLDGDYNISKAIEQLQAMDAVEEKYASMDPLIQKTKERLFASSLSDGEKKDFWGGFEDSFRKSLKPRDEVNASERIWLKDSIALYEFMKANEDSFHVKENKVVFASTDLLNEYNQKFQKADGERKEFLAAKERFKKIQEEGLGKIGLKPSDFEASAPK